MSPADAEMAERAETGGRIRAYTQWPLGIVIASMWTGWDLAAKAWLEVRLRDAPDHRLPLTPGLDLRLVYDQSPWPTAALLGSALAAILLLALLFRIRRTAPAVAVALGFAGFLGDLLDQLPDRQLTHFIAFRPFGLNVPCFNFSEVGIGALALYAAWTGFRRLRVDLSART